MSPGDPEGTSAAPSVAPARIDRVETENPLVADEPRMPLLRAGDVGRPRPMGYGESLALVFDVSAARGAGTGMEPSLGITPRRASRQGTHWSR